MSHDTTALTRALDRIASSVQVSGAELDALCRTHGKRAVLGGLLARCDAEQLRAYHEGVRAHRRSKVMRGQEKEHAAWLKRVPVHTAAWAAMRSAPVSAKAIAA